MLGTAAEPSPSLVPLASARLSSSSYWLLTSRRTSSYAPMATSTSAGLRAVRHTFEEVHDPLLIRALRRRRGFGLVLGLDRLQGSGRPLLELGGGFELLWIEQLETALVALGQVDPVAGGRARARHGLVEEVGERVEHHRVGVERAHHHVVGGVGAQVVVDLLPRPAVGGARQVGVDAGG